jgi:ribosomal protein L37AE/L43A
MNITKKICPNCGSEDVHMIAGGITGQWECKSCGHIGPILEKEIIESEQEMEKMHEKKVKGGKKG